MAQPLWQIHAREKAQEAVDGKQRPIKIREIQQRIQLSIQDALERTGKIEDISYDEMIRYMVHIAYRELTKDPETVRDFTETLKSPKHKTGDVTLTNNFHRWLPLATYVWNDVRGSRKRRIMLGKRNLVNP